MLRSSAMGKWVIYHQEPRAQELQRLFKVSSFWVWKFLGIPPNPMVLPSGNPTWPLDIPYTWRLIAGKSHQWWIFQCQVWLPEGIMLHVDPQPWKIFGKIWWIIFETEYFWDLTWSNLNTQNLEAHKGFRGVEHNVSTIHFLVNLDVNGLRSAVYDVCQMVHAVIWTNHMHVAFERGRIDIQGHLSRPLEFLVGEKVLYPRNICRKPFWWKQTWFLVQIFHDFSNSNTKPRPKSHSPAPSGWLAPSISVSLRFLMWALRRNFSDAGCHPNFTLVFVGDFFGENTKMYSDDEHHFITFDPVSRFIQWKTVHLRYAPPFFGGHNGRPQRNVWQWMFWISESQKA